MGNRTDKHDVTIDNNNQSIHKEPYTSDFISHRVLSKNRRGELENKTRKTKKCVICKVEFTVLSRWGCCEKQDCQVGVAKKHLFLNSN